MSEDVSVSIPRRILSVAVSEWARGVHEARGPNWERIKVYLKTIGSGTWKDYDSDGDAEWCGAFGGYVLSAAGMDADLLTQKTPAELGGVGSTYRLWCLAHLDDAARFVKPEDVQPGDFASFGRLGYNKYGEHLGFIAGTDVTGVDTYEGNASGTFPDGTHGQGVVSRKRFRIPTTKTKGIIFAMRPLPRDFR